MNTNTVQHTDHDRRLGEVADRYLQELASGRQPDIEQYAAEHPEIVAKLGAALMGFAQGRGDMDERFERVLQELEALGYMQGR